MYYLYRLITKAGPDASIVRRLVQSELPYFEFKAKLYELCASKTYRGTGDSDDPFWTYWYDLQCNNWDDEPFAVIYLGEIGDRKYSEVELRSKNGDHSAIQKMSIAAQEPQIHKSYKNLIYCYSYAGPTKDDKLNKLIPHTENGKEVWYKYDRCFHNRNEAANYFGVSVRAISNAIKNGTLCHGMLLIEVVPHDF